MKRLAFLVLAVACGGKSSPPPIEVTEQKPPGPTCNDLGDRTARDMAEGLPASLPADAPARFGALIAQLCLDDRWPQDVITCGMTADSPREECSPALDATQRQHIDDAQQKFTAELMATIHPKLGLPGCDELVASVDRLVACPKAVEAMGEQLGQIAAGVAGIYEVPKDQHEMLETSCNEGLPSIRQLVETYGC